MNSLIEAISKAQTSPRPWTRDLTVAMVLASHTLHRFTYMTYYGGAHWAHAQARKAARAVRIALEAA